MSCPVFTFYAPIPRCERPSTALSGGRTGGFTLSGTGYFVGFRPAHRRRCNPNQPTKKSAQTLTPLMKLASATGRACRCSIATIKRKNRVPRVLSYRRIRNTPRLGPWANSKASVPAVSTSSAWVRK